MVESAAPFPDESAQPGILDRRTGPHGEVVLRRHGDRLQIIANGCFLMDTSDGRSERLLVRAALSELTAGGPPTAAPALLVGGLGVGFSLAEAAAEPRWGEITVVEREAAVADWHRPGGPLAELTAQALADPRTALVQGDLLPYLDGCADRFDAICLDIDNGPDWTVTEGNAELYSPAGVARCRTALRGGGVLAVWSAHRAPAFQDSLLHAGFARVRTEEIPVARGAPDVVHFATKPA